MSLLLNETMSNTPVGASILLPINPNRKYLALKGDPRNPIGTISISFGQPATANSWPLDNLGNGQPLIFEGDNITIQSIQVWVTGAIQFVHIIEGV